MFFFFNRKPKTFQTNQLRNCQPDDGPVDDDEGVLMMIPIAPQTCSADDELAAMHCLAERRDFSAALSASLLHFIEMQIFNNVFDLLHLYPIES